MKPRGTGKVFDFLREDGNPCGKVLAHFARVYVKAANGSASFKTAKHTLIAMFETGRATSNSADRLKAAIEMVCQGDVALAAHWKARAATYITKQGRKVPQALMIPKPSTDSKFVGGYGRPFDSSLQFGEYVVSVSQSSFVNPRRAGDFCREVIKGKRVPTREEARMVVQALRIRLFEKGANAAVADAWATFACQKMGVVDIQGLIYG